MNQGFIKLHRKLLGWEWYDDPNTIRLFFHLLLRVNWEEKSWRGKKVKPGQLVTSREHLAVELNLGTQSIRTSLSKLKSTNEITIETTNNYTLISIVKWGDYQDKSKIETIKLTSKSTNNQPTTNQRLTTTKEVKEYKEVKKNTLSKDRAYGNPAINEVIDYLKKKLGGSLDGNLEGNRRFAHLLINRFKKDYPNKESVSLVKFLIEAGLQDQFHGKNVTSFKYLFYNAQKIIQSVKSSSAKEAEKPTVLDFTKKNGKSLS